MKGRVFVMYPLDALLLGFIAESRPELIHNGHTQVRFLLLEYEEDCSTAQGINEWQCSGNETISETSKLGLGFKQFIANKTVSKGREQS